MNPTGTVEINPIPGHRPGAALSLVPKARYGWGVQERGPHHCAKNTSLLTKIEHDS